LVAFEDSFLKFSLFSTIEELTPGWVAVYSGHLS